MPSRRVAEAVVDNFIQDGHILAFGHGSLAASLIELLASQRLQGKLKVIWDVGTPFCKACYVPGWHTWL